MDYMISARELDALIAILKRNAQAGTLTEDELNKLCHDPMDIVIDLEGTNHGPAIVRVEKENT